jgi:hypothetical protein
MMERRLNKCKKVLIKNFEMTDLGLTNLYLGVEFEYFHCEYGYINEPTSEKYSTSME